MFCKNCGKPNPDDATFCSNCGERLKDIGSSSKEDSLLDKFQGLDAKHKKWIYIYLVYVLIVFILSLDAYYDKYFYVTDLLQTSNGFEIQKCIANWSTK